MLQGSEEEHVNYNFLLQKTYQEALQNNEAAEKHWQKLKNDYEVVESLLSDLPKDLGQEVMVPLGPKAFMPGKIIHTNEILVSLGQGYFVKRSAAQATEISRRRRKVCSDMLSSLEKERELILTKSELLLREDAFGSGHEIMEPCNEEEEAQWRVEHRMKEKEYRQKLAEMKKKGKTHIDDEVSLWKRLDELELEEELEEELDRLHADSEERSSIEDNDENETDEEVAEEFVQALVSGKNGLIQKKESVQTQNAIDQDRSSSQLGRRVSFANSCEESLSENESEETLRIEFKHSLYRTHLEKTGCILTPGDIYTYFKDQFLSEPKSILKKSTSTSSESGGDNMYVPAVPADIGDYDRTAQDSCLPPVLQEVAERNATALTGSQNQQGTQGRISRFKATRLHKR